MSALALALDTSQRTVQRALVEGEAAGRVRSIGRARTRRWLAPPLAGFTTMLLLPASLPDGQIALTRRNEAKEPRHDTHSTEDERSHHHAEIVASGLFEGAERIGGVTHDGRYVWAAGGARLIAFDPTSGQLERTLERAADAGTAFDGTHLYQIAEARIDKIDPKTGSRAEVDSRAGPRPRLGACVGRGQSLGRAASRSQDLRDRSRHGRRSRRTIESNRFVTGVSWSTASCGTRRGKAMRAAAPRRPAERRRARTALEAWARTSAVSESDGADLFYRGGGPTGKVRAAPAAETREALTVRRGAAAPLLSFP